MTRTSYNGFVVPSKPNCIIYRAENAYSLSITDVDVLYQYICPFFNSLVFFSRKGIDFKTWSLILYLILSGYHVLAEGKALIVKLIQGINHKRYSSSKNPQSIEWDNKEIDSLLAIKPPFDIHSGLSHFILAKNSSIIRDNGYGFIVYIYRDGKEIPGSPFKSFR